MKPPAGAWLVLTARFALPALATTRTGECRAADSLIEALSGRDRASAAAARLPRPNASGSGNIAHHTTPESDAGAPCRCVFRVRAMTSTVASLHRILAALLDERAVRDLPVDALEASPSPAARLITRTERMHAWIDPVPDA